MPKQTLSLVPDAPIEGVDPSKFFQIPNWMAIKAIRSKLTGADWAVWTFLQMLDPHGDRLKDIPNPQEIGELVDLSAKQVKRSLVKLEEMGFYETEIVALRGRNLAGAAVKEARTTLPTKDKVVQQRTKLSSNRQSCPIHALKRILQETSPPLILLHTLIRLIRLSQKQREREI